MAGGPQGRHENVPITPFLAAIGRGDEDHAQPHCRRRKYGCVRLESRNRQIRASTRQPKPKMQDPAAESRIIPLGRARSKRIERASTQAGRQRSTPPKRRQASRFGGPHDPRPPIASQSRPRHPTKFPVEVNQRPRIASGRGLIPNIVPMIPNARFRVTVDLKSTSSSFRQ